MPRSACSYVAARCHHADVLGIFILLHGLIELRFHNERDEAIAVTPILDGVTLRRPLQTPLLRARIAAVAMV